MTILEKIRAELTELFKASGIGNTFVCYKALQIIDKYAEQEPCEDCDYSEIMDWEQDAKTGKAKPIYWCERHKEPCDDAISREELLKAIDTWDKFGCAANGKLVPYQDYYIPYIHYDDVVKCIKGMPSVRPQEQTKEEHIDVFEIVNAPWMFLDNCANSGYYCSKCKKKLVKEGWSETVKKINYCPNCGARMESD